MAALIDLLPILMLNRRIEVVTLVKTKTDHLLIFNLTDERQVQIRGERIIPHETLFTGADDLLTELWSSPYLSEIN